MSVHKERFESINVLDTTMLTSNISDGSAWKYTSEKRASRADVEDTTLWKRGIIDLNRR